MTVIVTKLTEVHRILLNFKKKNIQNPPFSVQIDRHSHLCFPYLCQVANYRLEAWLGFEFWQGLQHRL